MSTYTKIEMGICPSDGCSIFGVARGEGRTAERQAILNGYQHMMEHHGFSIDIHTPEGLEKALELMREYFPDVQFTIEQQE